VDEVLIPVVEHGRWRLTATPEDLQDIADEIRPPPDHAAIVDESLQDERQTLTHSNIQSVETAPRPHQQQLGLSQPIATVDLEPRTPRQLSGFSEPIATMNMEPQLPPSQDANANSTSPTTPPKPTSPTKHTSPTKPATPTDPEAPTGPSLHFPMPDATEVPADFDPCKYYRSRMAELGKSVAPKTLATGAAMSTKQIFEHIVPVVRDLNELHQPGNGYTVLEGVEGDLEMSEPDQEFGMHDHFCLFLHEFRGRTFLLLFQTAHAQTTVYVVDPAPWTINQGQRIALRESVHNYLGDFVDVPVSRKNAGKIYE
jgi:hypothetical protein